MKTLFVLLYVLWGSQKILFIDQPENITDAFINVHLSNKSSVEPTAKNTSVWRHMSRVFGITAFRDDRSYQSYNETYLHFQVRFRTSNKTSNQTVDFEPSTWQSVILNPSIMDETNENELILIKCYFLVTMLFIVYYLIEKVLKYRKKM